MADPFYADWKFWSVIVSAVALILSQLPPIHVMLRSARLEVEAYSRILLNHKIGNPNAHLYIRISNVGGREVRIQSITLHFERGTKDNFRLPARTYFQAPSDKQALLLTSFKLKPNEEWGHVVHFYNMFSRAIPSPKLANVHGLL
jgi:hypothetical protein